jgi:hypothetical protein
MDDKCFFASLIEDVSKDQKKTLPNKQLCNKITFVKKIGELITSCEKLSDSVEQRIIELCCSIVDGSTEFGRYDYVEIIRSLNVKI